MPNRDFTAIYESILDARIDVPAPWYGDSPTSKFAFAEKVAMNIHQMRKKFRQRTHYKGNEMLPEVSALQRQH